jgi:hypothetical protein
MSQAGDSLGQHDHGRGHRHQGVFYMACERRHKTNTRATPPVAISLASYSSAFPGLRKDSSFNWINFILKF